MPKVVVERLAVDEHLERPGAPGAFHCATQSLVRTQNAIGAGRRELDLRRRIRHRPPEPMREQIGRAHHGP